MSQLVVITFADTETGLKALESIQGLKKQGVVGLDDFALIEKDADGKVHVKNKVDSGTLWGAGIGGALGLMLAFIFPLAGLAIGAGGGALIGHMVGNHVDQSFVRQLQDGLTPGSSAIFLMIKEGQVDGVARALVAAMEPLQGTLYQTSLDSDIEEQLKEALK